MLLLPRVQAAQLFVRRLEHDQFRQRKGEDLADGPGHAQVQTLQRLLVVVEPVEAFEVDEQPLLPHAPVQLRHGQLLLVEDALQA